MIFDIEEGRKWLEWLRCIAIAVMISGAVFFGVFGIAWLLAP